jgi:drug/metabolite transporter (DMT)-like permease
MAARPFLLDKPGSSATPARIEGARRSSCHQIPVTGRKSGVKASEFDCIFSAEPGLSFALRHVVRLKDFMQVTNILLYAMTVLIWGSTWVGIRYQLGIVPPEWSIAYRMILAAVVLMIFCLATRRRMRFDASAHIRFLLIGLLLFSLNYFLMYRATGYIASGLVAVTFCFITVLNILNGALFFKTPLRRRVLAGALLGLVGIFLVFWPEIGKLGAGHVALWGFAFALLGTILASFGNMVSVSLQRDRLPVMQSNAWGLTYGAIFITLAALVEGKPMVFDLSVHYVAALLYLSLFGTVIAFYTYLTLLGRIGADRAAYSSILFPLIALTLSTLLEGYHWSAFAGAGVALVLVGNVIVLGGRKPAPVAA